MKTLQTLLDESIVDPMPPFTSVDKLIARERRRRARHRVGVACGAAAAVLAVIGGVAFFGTPKGGAPPLTINPAGPSASTSAAPSPSGGFVRPSHGAETDAEISARLDAAFLARLSTVVPGASLDQMITPFLGADRVTLAEHLTFSGKGTIIMPGGAAGVELYLFRPTPGTTRADPPGIQTYKEIRERVFGGCAGAFVLNYNGSPQPRPAPTDATCAEADGPFGSRLTLVQERNGEQFSNRAVAVFPDGSAVSMTTRNDARGDPGGPPLQVMNLGQLADIVADPALIP